MDYEVVEQLGNEAVPAPPIGASMPSEAEQTFNREIRQRWDARREALATAQRSKEEALVILLELGKRLSEAKERLARPERNGGWSSFARSAGLTRAEAEAATAATEGGPAAAIAGALPEAAEEAAVSVPENAATQAPEGSPAITEEIREEPTPTPTGDGQVGEAATEMPGGNAAPAPGSPGATVADAGSPAVA